MTPRMLRNKEIKVGKSFNICTWMQVMRKESYNLIEKIITTQYWRDRHSLSTGNASLDHVPQRKVWIYDVHGRKMLYTLLQHSMWNRKYHPFILCKCCRTAGLDEKDGVTQQCQMIDDDESTRYYLCLKRRFEHKKYDIQTHNDWCNENNAGITHFGVDPAMFNISTLRFDIFHCICAVTRTLMNYTRKFLLQQSLEFIQEFTHCVLTKFWSAYHIYCWNNKCSFSSFKRNELKEFIIPTLKIYLLLLMTNLQIWKSLKI